jgi:hypothetical protein
MAKHRLTTPRIRGPLHRGVDRTVDMLDVRTGVIHLVTSAAAAAGADHTGRFLAVCGAEVMRADDLTDPGFRSYCWSCRSVIPRQRSGS